MRGSRSSSLREQALGGNIPAGKRPSLSQIMPASGEEDTRAPKGCRDDALA